MYLRVHLAKVSGFIQFQEKAMDFDVFFWGEGVRKVVLFGFRFFLVSFFF